MLQHVQRLRVAYLYTTIEVSLLSRLESNQENDALSKAQNIKN